MASLKYKVEVERRRNLYFNKYSYRASIDIRNIQRLRYYESYDEYITIVKFDGKNSPLSNKDEIERYFDYVDNHVGDARVRIEYGKIVVYANTEAELILAVDKIQPTERVKFYSVIVPVETGTIEFVSEPPYKFRNYFRAKNISLETKAMLLNFINDQQSHGTEISFNDAMIKRLNRVVARTGGADYLMASYYVEYNDESLQALLGLMFGEYLSPKIFRLVKRPE